MRGKRVDGRPVEAGGEPHDQRLLRRGEASVSKRSPRSGTRHAGPPAHVRIIGGQWKRTPLPVLDAPGLRPSPDRVRETLFNWLAHLIPDFGAVRGLDLFAGTGALGFELASRGATRVTLVESNPALRGQLERTKQKLGATGIAIVAGDAFAFARSSVDEAFDVVFLDPPFDAGLLGPALEAAARLVPHGGLVYAESGVPLDPGAAEANGFQVVRAGRAGHVHFHLLQRA